MRKFLVHAKTFERIEDALKPFADQISPLVLSDEGDLKHPWGESEAKAAIAYGTTDAYFSPAVMTFFTTLFEFEQLDWFQSSAAGTEHPMIQATGKKAALFSGSHEQSHAIAEWVLWAGLDHFQDGAARRRAQENQSWERLPFREISSTSWLIIGFGSIGQESGRRLRALGAHVTGVRRSGGSSEAANEIVTPDKMQAALRNADAVLLSLPLTDATENMADAAFFEAMKSESLFVNVGRGGLVDEAALLAALDTGRLAQASLDVVREEPLSPENEIWRHPQITLTPHIAAQTPQSGLRTDKVFLTNLERFLAGEPLKNGVPMDVFA
ncbi:MAG: D-2-hydroxyacid dehydrogenase [Henriciella sp.]|nr:D-2-hydroxyacid dehydrogenase [Henriciella sp.]MBO6694212.1 D-2-hydroxyacid dehydrogenase [Henriciella sp.]